MPILSSKTDIQTFAKDLVGRLSKRYPPDLDKQPGKRPSVNRLTRIIEDTCAAASGFRDEHKLGWLGKARLGNAFRWELADQGYSKEFVDFATEAVIIHLSRKSAPAAAKP